MNAIEIKKFKRFLKEEGIFKLFIRRFDPKYRSVGRLFIPTETDYEDFHEIKSENVMDYLTDIDSSLAVFSAFEWNSTKEGFEFWKYVNNKWVGIPFISYAYEY